MTSPLPTPSKPTHAEGARPDMGNFFQFLSTPKDSDSSKTDFESLLNQRSPAKDLQEERESAKSRKKSLDAAAIAAPAQEIPATPRLERPEPAASSTQQTGSTEPPPEQPVAETSSQANTQAPKETSEGSAKVPEEAENAKVDSTTEEYPAAPEVDGAQDEDSTDSLTDPPGETPPDPVENKESAEEPEPEPSDANGMETAPTDPEMISLASIDGAETGAAAPREPSITSIHRLAAFAATDRNGLAPIGASGNSADSGLGQLATGPNAPLETRATTPASPAAQASALFKSLGPELEKFRQTGRNQMQLDIPVGENESVRIRLSLRAGELRSTFITESPELREALQKAWPEFAQTSRDRGIRLGDPSFQQGLQGDDPNGQNARRDRNATDSDQPAFPASRKAHTHRPPSNQTSTALWA